MKKHMSTLTGRLAQTTMMLTKILFVGLLLTSAMSKPDRPKQQPQDHQEYIPMATEYHESKPQKSDAQIAIEEVARTARDVAEYHYREAQAKIHAEEREKTAARELEERKHKASLDLERYKMRVLAYQSQGLSALDAMNKVDAEIVEAARVEAERRAEEMKGFLKGFGMVASVMAVVGVAAHKMSSFNT
jgi:hypothetical protein